MGFPQTRLRRLRKTEALRRLTSETLVTSNDLIQPLFIVPGSNVENEISSLPGQSQFSVDLATEKASKLFDLGIPAVLLFGIPESKDSTGSSACLDDGIIQRSIESIKKQVPELMVISDVCYCEYTDHGHCGILKDGQLDNDATLKIVAKQSLSHARAGVDMVAPSGMIDGMIGTMRHTLDESSFQDLPIMSYAAKFASSFYGPFREAADCAPQEGDRKGYQMDPANTDEAIREVELDIEEGADIVMIKPALPYLDVIRRVKTEFDMPTAAYNVSGEYAMIKAAEEKGWINGEQVMLETLLSIKRAGADIIISYFAEEFANLEQTR